MLVVRLTPKPVKPLLSPSIYGLEAEESGQQSISRDKADVISNFHNVKRTQQVVEDAKASAFMSSHATTHLPLFW